MSVDEQISAGRRARHRRLNRSITGTAVGFVVFAIALSRLSADSPLVGLLLVTSVACGAAWSLYADKRDALVRQQALLAFAIAAGAGMAWTAGEAVAGAVDSGYAAHPGTSLLVMGAVWVMAEIGLDISFAVRTRVKDS